MFPLSVSGLFMVSLHYIVVVNADYTQLYSLLSEIRNCTHHYLGSNWLIFPSIFIAGGHYYDIKLNLMILATYNCDVFQLFCEDHVKFVQEH